MKAFYEEFISASQEIREKAGRYLESSRREELQGLLKNGTFIHTKVIQLREGTRVLGSRFIKEVKRAEQGFRKKSRLVAQNYSDDGATGIDTKDPTV